MTTVPIRDGESTADRTALRHQAADEFGNATNLTPARRSRHRRRGAGQGQAVRLVILMGVTR
jgi:hypothetical protein